MHKLTNIKALQSIVHDQWIQEVCSYLLYEQGETAAC